MPKSARNTSAKRRAKVGIFMPCYNMGHFLDESLGTVDTQTFKDYYVVIADDASPSQESRDLLAKVKRPQCEVYFEKKNMGLVNISNKYLSSLDADYILLLSPDDKLHPDFLKEHAAYLDAHPDVQAVCSSIQEFGASNQLITYDDDKCKLPYMLVNNYYSGAALIRKSAWMAAGMHDTNKDIYPNIDWGVWLAMLEKGFKLATIPKTLFYWRVDPESISHRVTAEQTLRFRRAIFKRHSDLYEKHFNYVLDYYFEKLGNFEEYYVINEEGHAWLENQYHRLSNELASLNEENLQLKKRLSGSIETPLIAPAYIRAKRIVKHLKNSISKT